MMVYVYKAVYGKYIVRGVCCAIPRRAERGAERGGNAVVNNQPSTAFKKPMKFSSGGLLWLWVLGGFGAVLRLRAQPPRRSREAATTPSGKWPCG